MTLAAYVVTKVRGPLAGAAKDLWRRFCLMALVTVLVVLIISRQMTYHAVTKGERGQTAIAPLL